MSDRSPGSINKEAEEEALSALLDGELSAEREEEIRRRMANDPSLAARCAELAEVSGLLQKLVEPQPEPDRLQRMHEGLRARIEFESGESTESEEEEARGATVTPLAPRRILNLGVAAAALAAALALYLSVGERGVGTDPVLPEAAMALAENPAPVIEAVVPTPVAPLAEPILPEDPEGVSQWAQGSEVEEAVPSTSVYPEEVMPVLAQPEGLEVAVVETVEPMILPDSDERLAIALDYEVLADFDVISNLELLEFLGALDDVESM
jgi:anti-sigma factor RsiW